MIVFQLLDVFLGNTNDRAQGVYHHIVVDKLIFTDFGYGVNDLGFGRCPQSGFVNVLGEVFFGRGALWAGAGG